MGLIGSSNIPVNSATEFSFIYFYQSQIFISAFFVKENHPSYFGLIFSKLQQKFSFKIHVNLVPDVQNMFANFQIFLSARNYFVKNLPTQLSKSLCLMVMWISHSPAFYRGARWLSGGVSDSGARGPGFETYRRRVVSLSKTLYSPKVLVNYPGSDGSVPT